MPESWQNGYTEKRITLTYILLKWRTSLRRPQLVLIELAIKSLQSPKTRSIFSLKVQKDHHQTSGGIEVFWAERLLKEEIKRSTICETQPTRIKLTRTRSYLLEFQNGKKLLWIMIVKWELEEFTIYQRLLAATTKAYSLNQISR